MDLIMEQETEKKKIRLLKNDEASVIKFQLDIQFNLNGILEFLLLLLTRTHTASPSFDNQIYFYGILNVPFVTDLNDCISLIASFDLIHTRK